ncbi:DeoR/GlpR family DNA-binding transcription regulator [Galbitalea sp. SE-J8]|uniref:DeoR/GlpR family DNA-binding transcription regulator n=1 Tax=Galbitalea sp. SE-J8 TaxID=3054952 RepID=UPI00259C9533|nr:DeoR/GlpR family DNA-binding transcription regulator [Galbitalea sp. SE-J8]MDM4763881.1 DeoR/GlpR family DNA-binding transcription regulator [Galbitalea sp. SE-J8]
MESSDRRIRILEHVRERGELAVAELAERLQATPATVRRDLRLLEARGLVRRSYGMIAAVERSRFETPLAWRASSHPDEKSAIADAAVGLLSTETSVYIDEGVTARMVATRLPSDRPLTVVTPSIPVAAELAASTPHEVLVLGGRVRGRTLGAVDHWAREMLSGFAIDIAFLGANGVTMEAGLTTPDPAVATIKAMAVQVSQRRVFVGDHGKFGVTSFARFAHVSDIEVFVTSERLPLSQARRFMQYGSQLLRV